MAPKPKQIITSFLFFSVIFPLFISCHLMSFYFGISSLFFGPLVLTFSLYSSRVILYHSSVSIRSFFFLPPVVAFSFLILSCRSFSLLLWLFFLSWYLCFLLFSLFFLCLSLFLSSTPCSFTIWSMVAVSKCRGLFGSERRGCCELLNIWI